MKELMKTIAITFGILFVFFVFFSILWKIKGVLTLNTLVLITILGTLCCIFTAIYSIIPKSKKPRVVIDEEFYVEKN